MLLRRNRPRRHNLAQAPAQDGGRTSPRHARPARIRSGRVRIVGSLVVSVAVALGISIAISYFISLGRLDQRIDQDAAKVVRRLVRERCEALASIRMRGAVQSLNASVAAGIALYECARARELQRAQGATP